MNETLILGLALIAGVGLGLVFFGGLWWTVKKGISSSRPVLWFLSSLLLRTGFVLTGFYFIGRGHWQRLIICFLGFIIARIIVNYLTRKSVERTIHPAQEPEHASQS